MNTGFANGLNIKYNLALGNNPVLKMYVFIV